MFGKAFCYANRVVVGVPKSPKDKYRDAPSSSILRGPSEMRPIPNKKWVVSLQRMGQGVGAPLDVELGFANPSRVSKPFSAMQLPYLANMASMRAIGT